MSYVHHKGMFSFIVIPLVIVSLLFGIFSVVWLRSGVRTTEYNIALLEDKRMEVLKERKMFMAEKASLLSIQNVKNAGGGKPEMVFPDGTKVIYVKKEGSVPYRVSLERRHLSEP